MARRRTTARSTKHESSKNQPANNQKSKPFAAWLKRPDVPTAAKQAGGGRLVPSLVLPTASPVSSVQRRAQQQARRRRQTARRARRFESIVSRVQMPRSAVQRVALPSLRLGNWHPSRIVSLLLLLAAFGAIGWVHYDLEWYVYREHVIFHHLTYHEPDELYPLLEVEGWNVFWLSPGHIRERLIALPTIADAQVNIRPPHWVTIEIQEAVPVARWATQDEELWLLPDGTALARTDERYDTLPQIIDNERDASLWGDPTRQRMDPNVLQSALALVDLLPGIENLYFHTEYGLNFHMPGSDTWVYWGDGSNMEQKYDNLQAVRAMLQNDPQPVSVVDIRSERPVLKY